MLRRGLNSEMFVPRSQDMQSNAYHRVGSLFTSTSVLMSLGLQSFVRQTGAREPAMRIFGPAGSAHIPPLRYNGSIKSRLVGGHMP